MEETVYKAPRAQEGRTGLVLEGGGMRGIYTAGVLTCSWKTASALTGSWEFPQGRSTAAPWYPARWAVASAIIKNTAGTSGS